MLLIDTQRQIVNELALVFITWSVELSIDGDSVQCEQGDSGKIGRMEWMLDAVLSKRVKLRFSGPGSVKVVRSELTQRGRLSPELEQLDYVRQFLGKQA